LDKMDNIVKDEDRLILLVIILALLIYIIISYISIYYIGQGLWQ
jgi:hypothetical protein